MKCVLSKLLLRRARLRTLPSRVGRRGFRLARSLARVALAMIVALSLIVDLLALPATYQLSTPAFAVVAGPRVLGVTPGVGLPRGEIAGATPIAVTFSEPMNKSSAQSAFSIRPSVQGTFHWERNTLLFTPQRPLTPGASYTVGISAQARAASGRPLVAPFSTTFQTAPSPNVLRTLPTAGASEVPTDTIVTIAFDRPMIPITALSSQPDAGRWVTINPFVAGRWVWLGTGTAGFRADAGFVPATTYSVQVKAGWPDHVGVPLAQGVTFSFTTIKPAILSVSPSNRRTRVGLDEPVVVRFNQPMDRDHTQRAFALTLKGSNSPLPGGFEWSADGTVMTYTAASLLEFDRAYVASFPGQVRPSGGNPTPLAGTDNFWEFATTGPTRVVGHRPDSQGNRLAQPGNEFWISFNNPLASDQNVASYLAVDPPPEGYRNQLELTYNHTEVYTTGVKLLPNTAYRFELKPGLKDKWGHPVAPGSWEVRVGPLPPGLAIEGGSFQAVHADGPSRVSIKATNLTTVTLALYSLTDLDVLRNLGGERSWRELLREWQVPVPPSRDGVSTIYPGMALQDGLDRLPPGYYFLRVTAASPYERGPLESVAVLVVGRTGLVVKYHQRDLLIWATDLATGRPVPNYPLRAELIRYRDERPAQIAHRGRTGPDGVLRVRLDAEESRGIPVVWSEQPGDPAVAGTHWSEGIWPSSFGIPFTSETQHDLAAVYTDRPIYRPGHTVYFRGVYRLDEDARYTLAPPGTRFSLTASTYSQGEWVGVYTGTATLSAAGTFNGQFDLPATAPTGDYTLLVEKPGEEPAFESLARAEFQVEEYRKPDFQVSVQTRDSVTQRDPVTATISTSYYFGGPLANVTTTVNLWADPHYFHWADPDTGERYEFGEPDRSDDGDFREPWERSPAASFESRTDDQGLLVADLAPYVDTGQGSQRVLVEGQVQDLSNQTVADRAELVVHQGLYYIGLRQSSYVVTAGQPFTVTVRTVAPDPSAPGGGRAVANTRVSLRLLRQEWVEPPPGSGADWTLNEVPIGSGEATTDARGRAIYRFTPPSGGRYRIAAESVDARGNTIRSSAYVWVSNGERETYYSHWRAPDVKPRQVKLVADKEQYRVGDVARVLVTSPYTEATALLTIERGKVRRHSVVSLRGSAPVVEVPLEEGDLPNVYVGLTLLGRGSAVEGAPAGWPGVVELRQGYLNLPLDTSDKRLDVRIEPQGRPPFAPGSTASVVVRTLDSQGRPVSAELSLAAVDEAIFALADDASADLFETFWDERSLAVGTSSIYTAGEDPRLTGRVQPMPATGGGGLEQTGAPRKVRTDFRDTAFWRAAITTGPDGRAVVQVPLPDNLTTWRFTAKASSVDSRFGAANKTIMVTQPLLLRPVLPRFMVSGDTPHPQAIIHNNSGSTLQVEVSLHVTGSLTLNAQPPAVQRLAIGPGKQSVVTWSGKVGGGSVAGLRFWVRGIGNWSYLEDAVAMQLPVKPFAAPEMVAVSGEVAGDRAEESLFLPYSVDPVLGELVVQVSPSLAAATAEGVRYVRDFQYACSEQTTSRYLPLVALDQAYRGQGQKTPFSDELPGIVAGALQRLAELQQPDGGWGWWERGPSEWWQTAYVVHGLAVARAAGYDVPPNMMDRGVDRLRGFMSDNSVEGVDETRRLNARTYTLYVLAHAVGKDDLLAQEGRALAGQLPRMSNHARAWLAMALGKLGLARESGQALDSLAAAVRQSSTTAHWEESQPDYWSMGTNTRATAVALDALVTLRPADPLVPKVVRWLMSNRREGHWLSTQDTSFSLIAIAHYIEESKELTADYRWQVRAFDRLLGEGVASTRNITQTQTLRASIADFPKNVQGPLALSRSSTRGKMYYQASLRYYVPGQGILARSEGLAVTRSYHAMSQPSSDLVREARAGDLVRVRLTIVVPETSYYVLVTDPLPAGLESVNGSLNTTSFTERPPDPRGRRVSGDDEEYPRYYRWGAFDNVEMRDDRTVLFATYMAPGTYVYEYFARATTPGVYMALPAHAELMYFPDVFGRSDGGEFTVK